VTVRVRSPRFVGRQKELAALHEALERAEAGAPVVMMITGEAGVGKTRLIREFVGGFRRAGTRVLVGHCIPIADGGLPYAPIMEALRHLDRELDTQAVQDLVSSASGEFARWLLEIGQGDRVAGGNGVSGDVAQSRLFEFLLDLFGRLGQDGPVVLVVEDVHWADCSTLDFVSFLVRNVQRVTVMVVVTYRDDELHPTHPLQPWLAELRRSGKTTILPLRRLDRDETAEQLAGILGSSPDATLADDIFRRSEGNAFFTEELASVMAEGDHRSLPAGLRDILLARVHALSEPARSILGVAAAAGRRVAHELLSYVGGIPEDQLIAALRETVDHQILIPDLEDDSYTFRHALIQEATYSDLLPGERRRLHGALAETLTDHPELAAGGQATAYAELAHHWYAARNFPAALSAAIQAGQAAERAYGFAEALGQFERASELWNQVPHAQRLVDIDHAGVLEHAAEAAKLVGEYDRAVALIQKAIKLVDSTTEPARAGLLHRHLGWYLLNRGDEAAASDAYQEALRLIPTQPPSAERASVLVAAGRLSMFWAHYGQARAASEEAIELARAAGARTEEGHALKTLGLVAAYEGDFDLGIRYVRQALLIAEEVQDTSALAGGYIDLSHLLTMAGRLEEAAQVALEGCEVASRLGLERQHRPMLETNAAGALFELGRWEDATRLVAAAAQRCPSGVTEMAVLAPSAELAIAQGDFARAQQQLDRAATLCRNVLTPAYHRKLLEPRAELAIWQGRLEDATAAVAEGLQLFAQSDERSFAGRLFMLGLRAQADHAELVRARQAAADVASATQQAGCALLEEAIQLVADPLDPVASVLPEGPAVAAVCEAEKSRLDGHSNPALWAAAAARWDELGRPYPAAYARWRQAEACLTAKGTRSEAGPVLRQAHEVVTRLGAKPLRRELERLARRASIDLEKPSTQTQQTPQQPSVVEEVGLSPRELEVLQHLAAGRSNHQIAQALFISRSTASVHVSHILCKLGVCSRVEAAGLAYRLGLVDGPLPT
jgi:ATP/maltotriose-dependent transcriptional regulator MalT